MRAQQAQAGLESRLGETHPEVALCLHGLASSYNLQGDHARAAPMFARAEELRRAAVGGDHIDTLSSAYCHAVALLSMGEAQRAEAAAGPVLERLTALRGGSHKDTLSAMSFVASIQEALGQTAEAEALYTKVGGAPHANPLPFANIQRPH